MFAPAHRSGTIAKLGEALLLAITVELVLIGCRGGSSTTQLPVAVSVSPSSATVQAGGTQQFSAYVQNDPANKGVTWSISPSTGTGSLSNATSTSVTYNPPSSAPATNVNVTITATSVADPTKSASAAVTVSGSSGPLTITVTPSTASVQPGKLLQVTATVANDPANAGVSWEVSCTSALAGAYVNAQCGSISPAATTSGTPTTYTAPTFGDLTVTVTATSVTNGNVVASATIAVPGLAIVISPASMTVPVGSTKQVTATVVNDSSNQGVTWTLTDVQNGSLVPCPSAAVCGTVSPSSTPSGTATTYTAPTAPPAGDLEVDLVATSVANTAVSTQGVQGFITVPGISVAVAPSTIDVEAGTTAQFTATVANDPSNKGVTWTVSCSANSCGSVSPTTTSSGTTTTFTAPGLPPSSDLAVTVTAASVTNPAATGSSTVTVPAIAVSVNPLSALLPLKTSLQITPTVSNDPDNKGVSWTLTQNGTACTPACGSIAPASTPSGSPITYTGPATMPSNATVTITASSVTNPANTAAVGINLTAGTVELVPDSLDFGRVLTRTTSAAQTITLTNTGTSALHIDSFAITGADPQDFAQTNTCNSSVSAQTFCTISVTFTPVTFTTRTATLSIIDSSTDNQQQASLSGIGFTKSTDVAPAFSGLAQSGQVSSPAPTGRSVVGTRVIYLTDPTRNDPFAAASTPRELAVRLWYPALLNQRCQTAEYTSPAVWKYFAELANVPPFQVNTNSCLNAPVADGDHPVVLFTPGYTATFTDYTFLFEDLASRGYVVVSVAHTFEATAVELHDGKLAKSVLGSHLNDTWRGDEQTFSLATRVRLEDMEFVLNQLGKLNAESSEPFTGRFDLSKVAIAGHSMGGTTAFLAARLDNRFKAAIMLDAPVPEALATTIATPVLILAAGRKKWDTGECRLWSGLQGPRLAVNLPGSEHAAFSDWIWLAKDAVQTGPMGPEKTMSALRDYVSAFLDANLRQEPPDSLLSGRSADYSGAVIVTRGQSLCADH